VPKTALARPITAVPADWLSTHLEEWTVTSRGELVKGKPRHYVRITPADPKQAVATSNPDEADIFLANGSGQHPARNIVGGDFLHLVRLGVRAANDPVIVDSLAVIDQVLKRDLPQGPCWRRYNHDGYGQKADGSAYDGSGEGRCWPILTGERAHYELAAGRNPSPYIEAMEKFANIARIKPPHDAAEQRFSSDTSIPCTGQNGGGKVVDEHLLAQLYGELSSKSPSRIDDVNGNGGTPPTSGL